MGIDLDRCRGSETGETEDWAAMIIDQLDSYTEINPPRTGYHIIVKGVTVRVATEQKPSNCRNTRDSLL